MTTMHAESGKEGGNGELLFNHQVAQTVDLHLSLSRALLLQGAFEEADGHVRASSRLAATTAAATTTSAEENSQETDEVTGDVGVANAATDTASFRLELELLSRTPVVLTTAESAKLLRGELLHYLGRLRKRGTGFGVSIPNPLEVGVRAQFLAAYQVRRFFGRDNGGRQHLRAFCIGCCPRHSSQLLSECWKMVGDNLD